MNKQIKCNKCNQIMERLDKNNYQCPKCNSIENKNKCEICGDNWSKCQHGVY